MTTTLVLPHTVATTLHEFASLGVETGAVLLARPVHSPSGDLRLLAREVHAVPNQSYELRDAQELCITSGGYVPVLRRAEETATIPIWLHTHVGDGFSPRPSRHDKVVDDQLADLFRLRSGSEFYGAVIVSHRGKDIRFTGHLAGERQRLEIDRLLTVGPRLALAWNDQSVQEPVESLFDRNIRAFGGDVQRVLRDLKVAIVGCGGIGSCVAEQLVRLGVRELLLVDPDSMSESNLTRVYGSGVGDVGRPKVDVLADHLQRIAPDVSLKSVGAMITVDKVAQDLSGVDVIFGCTDDNAGRLVLSRIATYMLIPVIDSGVLLTSDNDGLLDGIYGRVTRLYPGAGCLVCRNRIDLARAGSEMLTPDERVQRADEGYAPALPGVEPAVVAYTTLVASTAVGELLESLVGYGPNPVPSEILLRVHEREISTNEQTPRQGHYCDPDSGKLGLGMTDPFLEQTWQH